MLERWVAAVVLVGGILLAATFWQSASVPHELPEEAVEPPREEARPPERAPVVEERDEDDEDDEDDRDRDREERRKEKRGKRGGDDD